MKALTFEDLAYVVRRIPRDIRDLCKTRGVIVGGGFIRDLVAGEEPTDIDLFGPTKDSLQCAAQELKDKWCGRPYTTGNAYTVSAVDRRPAQFIYRWLYSSPALVAHSFDFSVCCAVVWWDSQAGAWASAIHDRWYSDLAARRLFYLAPKRDEDAGGSALRVLKFARRGWRISPESYAMVIAQLVAGFQKRFPGAPEDWTEGLASLLREVDPLLVIDGLEVDVDGHEENSGLAIELKRSKP